jgi:putative alpha-1,2-mannosidase
MLSRRALLGSAASGLMATSVMRASIAYAQTPAASPGPGPGLTADVDPMIGAGGHGHVFPGASMPFGMVQLSSRRCEIRCW